jgi:hypothetical protein
MSDKTRGAPTHSPVPWELDDDRDVADATGRTVAFLYAESNGKDLDADRRLILKAPDLLAAVRRWLLRCEAGSVLVYSSNYAEIRELVDHIDGECE